MSEHSDMPGIAKAGFLELHAAVVAGAKIVVVPAAGMLIVKPA